MRDIMVKELAQTPLFEQPLEVCERKGIGHPDTICDAMLNQVSNQLSQEYLKHFGYIMHHNIDKGLLVAGEVKRQFNGGIVKKPMLLVFGDRATFKVEEEEIPVVEITLNTAKKWFKDHLRFVDPERHVKYQVELKRGSEALTDIFKRKGALLGANDTSAAVGFAPFTETERIVMNTEWFLNSENFKREHPESGEDIKIMGIRRKKALQLTVAMAFVDKFIDSENTYYKRKEEILEEIHEYVSAHVDMTEITINLNTLDERGRGMGGMYLTVLGTSADDGDCGQVGRGNRVNGIIPLNRPTSSEAAAGKNPVSHVGKIYNMLSYKIANEIYTQIPGIKEVYVWLVSQIGQSIDKPMVASAELILDNQTRFKDVEKEISEIIDYEFVNIDKFCKNLLTNNISVC